MNRILFLLLSGSLAICSSLAVDDDQSQSAQNRRALDDFKRADRELTTVFDDQLAKAEKTPAIDEALAASQKAWVAFRDADAQYESVLGNGGSARSYYMNERMTYLTKQRIYQLKTPFAQGWAPVGR